MHEQTNSKNSPDSFSSSCSSVHRLRNTWGQPAWTHGVNWIKCTPYTHPASRDTNPNNVGAYFLTNSLCSTSGKYTFCVLVPVCILHTIAVHCVLGLSWVEHLTKRIHIYHFHKAYCLVIWIHAIVQRDQFWLWWERRCASLLTCRVLAPVS